MKRKRILFVAVILMLSALHAQAELRAGLAVANITPPIGGRMAGYGDRLMAVSKGVHDPLGARALVLSDGEDRLAMITLDLAGLGKESLAAVKAGVKEKTGIEAVMVLSSHTHSGPEPSRDFPSKEESWLTGLEEKLVDAVAEAHAGMAPVLYGVGKGEVHEGHNRRKVNDDGTATMLWRNEERVPTAPVDYELGVIQFKTLDGELLATLVNFTCHPVILGPKNLLFSADYPGVMRRIVEENLGGSCLFANGACGDINPFMDKSDPAQGAFEEVEKMGRTVAEEVIRVAGNITMHGPGDVDLTAKIETIPLALRWDIEDPDVLDALYKKYTKFVVTMALKRLVPELPVEGDLVTVTLGDDVAIAGLPGEFFVEHGLSLKARSAIPNTFAFGYCGNSLGYFPTINAAWEGGYGGKEATIVAVGAGEKLINRALVNLYYQTGRLSEIPNF